MYIYIMIDIWVMSLVFGESDVFTQGVLNLLVQCDRHELNYQELYDWIAAINGGIQGHGK